MLLVWLFFILHALVWCALRGGCGHPNAHWGPLAIRFCVQIGASGQPRSAAAICSTFPIRYHTVVMQSGASPRMQHRKNAGGGEMGYRCLQPGRTSMLTSLKPGPRHTLAALAAPFGRLSPRDACAGRRRSHPHAGDGILRGQIKYTRHDFGGAARARVVCVCRVVYTPLGSET